MIVKKKIQKIEATTVFSLESFFLPMAHTDWDICEQSAEGKVLL
jgi:hypothetical protein